MSAVTVSALLEELHDELELDEIGLDISNEKLLKIVKAKTLPTFSKYYPYMVPHIVRQTDVINNHQGFYKIEREDLEVLGVAKIITEGINNTPWGDQRNIATNDIFTQQLLADLISATQSPITYDYHSEGILELFPKTYTLYGNFMAVIKCIHPDHLTTISKMEQDRFFELAVIDCKITLWRKVKRFNEMETTYGSINLMIEDWAEAKEQRKEWMEISNADYLKSSRREKIFVF